MIQSVVIKISNFANMQYLLSFEHGIMVSMRKLDITQIKVLKLKCQWLHFQVSFVQRTIELI